jgi:hypothetical protein
MRQNLLDHVRGDREWQFKVFASQVRLSRPDVLYVQDIGYFPADWLKELRDYARLIVGQTAHDLDWNRDYRVFDLILTSFPHYVDRFRSAGIRSEYFKIGFEPTVLDRLGEAPAGADVEVGFVGGLSQSHATAQTLLEQVASRLPAAFWGYGIDEVEPTSAIHAVYQGQAWGLDAYRALRRSKVSLNRHSAASAGYANNMRLFESTGVGTCMVTDAGTNLGDLFVLDREVVAYENAEDCIERISYLLDHESDRQSIAIAGQLRTLREHTYHHRMVEMVGILEGYGNDRRSPAVGYLETPPSSARSSWSAIVRGIVRESPAAPGARLLLTALRRARRALARTKRAA